MTTRERGLRDAPLALLLLCAVAGAASAAARAAKTYTNDDLDRVRPLRAETGVTSEPAFARPSTDCASGTRSPRSRRRGAAAECDTGAEPSAGARAAAHDESYWRREAERVRTRVRAWDDQIEDLELKIDARRRLPGVPPYSDPQIVAWQRRADTLRQRAREAQNELDERAHRAGVLPGWLR